MTFTVQLIDQHYWDRYATPGITINTTKVVEVYTEDDWGTPNAEGRVVLDANTTYVIKGKVRTDHVITGDITIHSTGDITINARHHPPAKPPTQGRGVGTDSSEQAGTHDDLDDQVMEWLADFNQAAAEDKKSE